MQYRLITLFSLGILLLLSPHVVRAGHFSFPVDSDLALPLPPPDSNMTVALSVNNICPGDSATVQLGASQIGVLYQLRDSITKLPIGIPVFGTGAAMGISSGPVYSTTSFEILATDTSDLSTAILDNMVTLTTRQRPTVGVVPDAFQLCLADTLAVEANGHALNFNGTNQSVSIPHSPLQVPTNQITVEAWIFANNWSAAALDDVIVSKMELAGVARGYELAIGSSGVPSFSVGRLGQNAFTTTGPVAPLTAATWYHLAGTYDGVRTRLFIDGVQVAMSGPAGGTIEATTQPLTIGKNSFLPFRFFDGQIDEVRIWDVALTANQIAARKDQPLGGNETGLIAYYDFNYDNQGMLLTDMGPNGFDGTLVNLNPMTDWFRPGAIPLTPPGVNSYFWDFGDATSSTIAMPQHVYASPGNYTITGTLNFANGCQETDSAQIVVVPSPVVNLGPDTSYCGGPPLVFDAGNPGAGYLWSNSATSQVISVNAAGQYSVTVTDANSCVGIDTVDVTSGSGAMLNLGPDTTICQGQSLTLDAGTGWASILWSTTDTVQTTTVSTAGTYYVDVLDSASCPVVDSIVVSIAPAPTVNLGPDTVYCGGPPITLDAGNPGATYLWSTNALSQTIAVMSPGQYSVIVTAPNTCVGRDTVDVLSSGGLLLNLGPDTTLCQGQSLTLDAGPGWASYLWSTTDTVQTTTVNAAGTYYVDVVDSSNCPAVDSIRVAYSPLPVVNIGPDVTQCAGTSLLLDAGNPGLTYLWSNNATTQQITVTQAGAYSVTVTNPNQCAASDTMIFSQFPGNPFSLGADTILCFNETLLLDVSAAGVSQTWSTGATTPTLTISMAGAYWVDVVDANSCTTRDSIVVSYTAPPQVTLSGLNPAYCANDPLVNLVGTPGGGTFYGPGVSGASFDPGQITAPDTVQIIYGFAPPLQCEGRDTLDVIIRSLPTVTFTGLDPAGYCVDAPAVALAGNPAGGTFSGPGIAGSSFDPAQAGAGLHSIAYAYTDGQGCTGTENLSTEVFALPQVSFSGLATAYCETGDPVTLTGVPVGGTFAGPGVAGGVFDPAAAGPAAGHTLTYTFVDGNGCQGDAQATVAVDVASGTADAGLDQELWLDDRTQLAAVPPAQGSGTWTLVQGTGELSSVNDPNADISGLSEGLTLLEWTVANGACSATGVLRIEKYAFEEKRGFSPNGDGKNDFFVIEGLERYPDSKMIVRSRWGEVVLEAANYANDWAGETQSGAKLPDDTYFFELQVSNGRQFKGFVVLRR